MRVRLKAIPTREVQGRRKDSRAIKEAELIGLGRRLEVGEGGGIMNDPQFSDYVDSGMHMGLDPGIGKWGEGKF